MTHTWLTRFDTKPDLYDDDAEGAVTDRLAYSAGYHNGPRCKVCGYYFCEHCNPEGWGTECKPDAEPVKGNDANLYTKEQADALTALGYAAIASR